MANTLQHSPSEIIRQALIDLGLGVAGSWSANAYTGQPWPVSDAGEPDRPDNAITVYDTTGRALARSMLDGSQVKSFGFQVRVRAVDHRTGWLKADAVQTALEKSCTMRQVSVAGVVYIIWCCEGIGPVLPLGTEAPKSKRKLFTINASLAVTAH